MAGRAGRSAAFLAREWRTLSDGDGLWVQAGDGPPARVLPDATTTVASVRTTGDVEPWRLAAPDGAVHDVTVAHAVLDVVGTADGVHLCVDVGRGERIDLGMDSWAWGPEPEWVLVPWGEPVPREVSTRSHAVVAPPAVPSSRLPGWRFVWHPDDDPAGTAGQPRLQDAAGGLHWRLGRDAGGFPWTSPATGRDPLTGVDRLRVPLGRGEVLAVLGSPDGLFVALAPRPDAAGVVHVDPRSGAATEVLPAGTADVAEHARPLGPRPADHDSHVRYWAGTWAGDDGAVEPVHEDMRAARATVVGDWPGTTIEITFDWAPLPGLRLPLFDDLGRHTPPEYSGIHLMEDLATGKLPPPTDAVDGVLDV